MSGPSERPPSGVTRQRVEAIANPLLWSDAAIRAAVDACDYDGAAVLLFARARSERPPADLVASIAPWVDDPVVGACLLAIADPAGRGEAWIRMLRGGRFPLHPDRMVFAAIAVIAAHEHGAPEAEVVREARRLAHFELTPIGFALFDDFAIALGDKRLLEDTFDFAKQATDEDVLIARALHARLGKSVAELVAKLPEEAARTTGFTVRAVARVGRNEPCPCGSGQKYKRCCADKDAAAAPSPVAGASWDDYVADAARLGPDEVAGLPLRDLARVDLAKLDRTQLDLVQRRFEREALWPRAETVIAELDRRGEDSAEAHEALGMRALFDGDLDVAERHLRSVADPNPVDILELDLRRNRPDALTTLASYATSVAGASGRGDYDLASALLRSHPGLGLLVARGCIASLPSEEARSLLEGIEDARVDLGLPLGDPAWDLVPEARSGKRGSAKKPAAPAAETDSLRNNLRATSARVSDLESELAAKHAELEKLRAAPRPTAAEQPLDNERLRALRGKVEELEGLVRAGNVERGELRRQLAATTAAPARAVAQATPLDDDEGDPVDPVERGVATPTPSRELTDATAEAPRPVAAEALRTIGALAAGDATAWRRIKQARDMSRQVLMTRIGIHYRLLFRVEAGILEVIDLVTRESLLTTLKRLRQAR